MKKDYLYIKGAKEHNLKDISLKIPHQKLTVITGLSGSGKSSLAFDTIYAEGQRRYVESLSSYARQFLERLQKPHVDHIEGLSPAISIEQKKSSANPRSIVATQTEIYDYFRLLYASIGEAHCYKCGKIIERQSTEEIIRYAGATYKGLNIEILSPLVKGKKGQFKDDFDRVRKSGYIRVCINGKIYLLDDVPALEKNKKYEIDIVVDRLILNEKNHGRFAESIETALQESKGYVSIRSWRNGAPNRDNFNKLFVCRRCHINVDKLEPRSFSFNSPYGACPDCVGLGNKIKIDITLAIPDKSKKLIEAIEPWRHGGMGIVLYYRRLLRRYARTEGFDVATPFGQLPGKLQKSILYGDLQEGEVIFEGVIPNLERRFNETESEYVKSEINKYMSIHPCPKCKGSRLKLSSLAVTVGGHNISELCKQSISDLGIFFKKLRLSSKEVLIAKEILKEIVARLSFLENVGLGYLTLSRQTGSLSGGEFQRIRLATQIGSGLVGVLYVLDEPSIGLHQKDNDRLLSALRALRDIGNTLVVVEHDEATIRQADHVVDLGPGDGEDGGQIIAEGTPEEIIKSTHSLTGKYLAGRYRIELPEKRRRYDPKVDKCIRILGACENNLKNIDVDIPLGFFVCVTGVSGSGKSTLVDEIIYKALSQKLYRSKARPGKYSKILKWKNIDKVVVVDQSPIGRTPRSNPATYTGCFSFIRDLYSKLPEARVRGYAPGRFSFNVKGGRCESCQGDGMKKIEMHFLPDVYLPCEVCKGRRFNLQTLEVLYKGHSISDVLEMSVEAARDLFEKIPQIRNKLTTLCDVGLGYIRLGQSATTLSGGEAQRVKLATELSRRATGRTLYILDEPTTGLHFADVAKLLEVLHRLVSTGNTVLVIEHNLDVIKTADFILDLGPEGGDQGGYLVASGSPEDLSRQKGSHTGTYLKKALKGYTARAKLKYSH